MKEKEIFQICGYIENEIKSFAIDEQLHETKF